MLAKHSWWQSPKLVNTPTSYVPRRARPKAWLNEPGATDLPMSDMPDNDSELSAAMDRILAYAQEQMPESIFCIMSFTQVEWEGQIYSSNKIKINSEDRRKTVSMCAGLMAAFVSAPVEDRRMH